MKTHQQIDARSLALARAVVARIDADPRHEGLEKARHVCRRWAAGRPEACHREWLEILERPWSEVRELLLEDSETGRRRRQSSPFCGILTPAERWGIYRDFQVHATE
ncbi:MAG: hypothetical protein AB1505_26405 [Candidatus Latescibacterota bacterium]